MRVVSTVIDEATDRSTVSSSSSSLHRDYEIRRRWDDCLWFQEALELEYSIQAREKRRRLEQGKGVKKNGVYLDSKQAASFDSLPPGPDPTSISSDIHDYVPKLSKKATLFRVNQATIDQRQQQFARLIDGLFAPGVPTLVQELRGSTTFRDFFGWWRRDKDFARKHGPDKGKSSEVPTFGSIPFYLDTSNPSQVFSDTSSRDFSASRSMSTRPVTADAMTSGPARVGPHSRSREDVLSRRRRTISSATPSTPAIAISSASTNGSCESRPSSRASLHSALSSEISPTVVMWDGQEQLNASDRVSPHALLNAFPQTPMVKETFENIQCPPSPEADSPILGLEALPEESELEPSLPQMSGHENEPGTRPPITRSRRNSASDSRHRNAIVFSPEVVLGDIDILEVPDRSPTTTDTTVTSSRHSSFFSNASFATSRRTSASDLPPCPSPRRSLDSYTMDTVDYSSSSPASPQSPWLSDNETLSVLVSSIRRNPRESSISINSIMTDASVDHVLPRSTPKPGDFSVIRSFSPGPRGHPQRFVPMSVPEEEGYPEDFDDGILESYLYGEPDSLHFPFCLRGFHSSVENFSETFLHPVGIEEMDISGESESTSEDPHPHRERLSQRPTSEQLPKPFQNRPPEQFHLPWTSSSPTSHPPSSREQTSKSLSPTSMTSTNTMSHKIISIKAYMTEEAIIVFRAVAETTYAEIREKIFDKFANQEGISLRPDFPLAYLAPASSRRSTVSSVYSGIARKRAGSVGSASNNESSLLLIQSQEFWEEAVRDSDGKLTLRVFE